MNQQQAQALFDAGGFIVFSDLPEGAEFGIDGTHHIIKKFSGIKFLPPGLHVVTYAPPNSGPATVRSGIVRFYQPKERYVLEYDAKTEEAHTVDVIISDDQLKTLDKELAPYPFSDSWRLLTRFITPSVIDEVLPTGSVDSMTEHLHFPEFDLKRSWRNGAVGEEITRYSRDKSWLLSDVLAKKPHVLAYLQLSFLLFAHLSSYAALEVYKRFLSLLCQSSIKTSKLYRDMIPVLTAQLAALPSTAFDAELPEMDVFYLEQINHLREHLISAKLSPSTWSELRSTAKAQFGWEIEDLSLNEEDEEDEEEEGEFAPVVV